jgi:STE24 endopeptidase
VAVWIAAAWALTRTSVPSDLALPDLDPRKFFSSAFLEESASFERFLIVDSLLAEAALLGVLWVYAKHAERFTKQSAAGPIGTGLLLGMLAFAFVWLAQLPFGLAQLWWERKHDVAEVGYVEWAFEQWFFLGAQFLFLSAGLAIVMALAKRMGNRWWIAGGPVFVAIVALFSFVTPFLLPDTHPLRDKSLSADAERLARVEGVSDIEVMVQDVGEFTDMPNAEAAGFGPTRRVILWDTLAGPPFKEPEIRSVIAHELAHHSRNHIVKSLGLYALYAIPAAFIVAMVTRRRGGMYRASAVPLALFTLALVGFAARPLENSAGRRLEAEADWVGLQATREPDASRAAFKRLATTSKSRPDSPFIQQLLFDSHPAIIDRMAMVEAWKKRSGR